MKLPRAACLVLSVMLTGGGCFGRCIDVELAPHGLLCSTAADCIPGVCQFATCVAGQCKNEHLPVSAPCGDATAPTWVCNDAHECVKCRLDGVKNDSEGGVDCGEKCDSLCADTKVCTVNADCQNGVCDKDKKLCLPATCSDDVTNGPETDVDCGGTCFGCANKKNCGNDADCEHGHCAHGICCGVACEGACRTCASGACELVPDGGNPGFVCPGVTDECDGAGHCKSCTSGHLDPDETDVDCGGPICPPCTLAGGTVPHCKNDADCATCMCVDDFCASPACADGKLNGCETDVDCGGPCGPTCTYGQTCHGKMDCLSKICMNGKCGEP